MRKELDEALCEKYPKIFVDRHADMRTTAMCWGFDCDNGWYWILDNLCGSIQGYIDSNDKPQVVATQVKEKFGTLSFYYHGGDDIVFGMVWLAEHMSANTCEKCGSIENVIQTKGWICTLCDKCLELKNTV